MHNRNEWIRVYGDLMWMNDKLHETAVVDTLDELVVRVLMMLVEDKIERAEDGH